MSSDTPEQPRFAAGKDQDFNVASMRKYVANKPEMDKVLERELAPLLAGQSLSILDAGCGIGHLIHGLHALSPTSRYVGVDQTDYLIDDGRRLCAGMDNITLEHGDVDALPARYPKAFDIALSWKVLMWVPRYERMLQSLFAVTRGHIFISSLFYDGDIDFEIRAREYQKEAARDGYNAYYNVYSLPRFAAYARSLGARDVHAQDFEIGIDLPRPPADQMGTYTVKLDTGKRLQISGAVLMLWKIVRIDL